MSAASLAFAFTMQSPVQYMGLACAFGYFCSLSCSMTPRGKWSQPRRSVISSQPHSTGEVMELGGVCCPKARALISYQGSALSAAQGHVPLLWSRTADPSLSHKSMRQAYPCPHDPSEHTPVHLRQKYPSNEKKNN